MRIGDEGPRALNRSRPASSLRQPSDVQARAASGPSLNSGRPELATTSAPPSAITDPRLARFAHVRQLIAERFHIVARAPAADTPPHTISAHEARALGTLICNVVSGAGQLTFDPQRRQALDLRNRPLAPLGVRTSALLEALMIDDLTRIAQTRVGRAVLRELTAAQHRTTIIMEGDKRPSSQALNVSTESLSFRDSRVYFTPGISYAKADWSESREGMSPWELVNPSHSVLLHELLHARGTVYGLRDATQVAPEDGVPGDAGKVSREEHRVIGLGKYAGDALTQTRYIEERNAIAQDGFGAAPGDALLVTRTAYASDPRRSMSATRDPVYADLVVALELDAKPDMPAHVCAWAQRNSGGMLQDDAFIAALSRATNPRYAAEVAQALTVPREEAWQAYLAWVNGQASGASR